MRCSMSFAVVTSGGNDAGEPSFSLMPTEATGEVEPPVFSKVEVVLVVEDDALLRQDVCEELQAQGYEVITAPDADVAVRILEGRNDIRAIFTDIDMPGSMDGLKLAAAVRERWPPVNIIITTSKTKPSRAEMPSNARFVAKPYSDQRTADRASLVCVIARF